jgi:hypothetical protein
VKCDRYTTHFPLIGQQRVHNRLQATFGSGGSASSVCVSQSRSFVVRHIWRLSDSIRIMITSVPQKGCVCNPAAPCEMKHACRHGATLGNPCAERQRGVRGWAAVVSSVTFSNQSRMVHYHFL